VAPLLALAAAGLASGAASAQPPPYNIGTATSADIVVRTDKPEYEAGETVQFCWFMFERPGEKTTILTVLRPDGRQYNLFSVVTRNLENCFAWHAGGSPNSVCREEVTGEHMGEATDRSCSYEWQGGRECLRFTALFALGLELEEGESAYQIERGEVCYRVTGASEPPNPLAPLTPNGA
jgi:hypothetical protein